MEVKMKLGEYLRLLRQSRGLTQAELAQRAGLHVRAVRQAERGDVRIRVSSLVAIGEALGVQFEFEVSEKGGIDEEEVG